MIDLSLKSRDRDPKVPLSALQGLTSIGYSSHRLNSSDRKPVDELFHLSCLFFQSIWHHVERRQAPGKVGSSFLSLGPSYLQMGSFRSIHSSSSSLPSVGQRPQGIKRQTSQAAIRRNARLHLQERIESDVNSAGLHDLAHSPQRLPADLKAPGSPQKRVRRPRAKPGEAKPPTEAHQGSEVIALSTYKYILIADPPRTLQPLLENGSACQMQMIPLYLPTSDD